MTSTRYVFTINNPEAPLDTAAWEAAGVRHAVWQLERGAEGTRRTCRAISRLKSRNAAPP